VSDYPHEGHLAALDQQIETWRNRANEAVEKFDQAVKAKRQYLAHYERTRPLSN